MNKFLSLFFRSLFIQAGWNFMKFQNIGFLFALQPLLKKTHTGENYKKALLRHSEIFNTQPYMASFVLGNVAAMEEKTGVYPQEQIIKIKQALACAYASIGDRIFWARLRITVYLFTIILYFALSAGQNSLFAISEKNIILLSLLLPTILYNFFSVYIRWIGLFKGYACAGSGTCGLDFLKWNSIIKIFSRVNFLFLALAVILILLSVDYLALAQKGTKTVLTQSLFVAIALIAQRYFKKIGKPLTFTIGFCFLTAFVFALFNFF